MAASFSKKCFYKNGKKLKIKEPKPEWVKANPGKVEAVTSLFASPAEIKAKSPKVSVFSKLKSRMNPQPFITKLPAAWASFSVVLIFGVLTSMMLTPQKAKPQDLTKYAIYSSTPLVLQQSTTTIYSKDSRAEKIDEVFKMFHCPLEGTGDVFVYEADKYSIPWWLTAAVAFQESSCGKNTPKIAGSETYNAWGWAVYGDIIYSFDSWAKGIETVSKYFGKYFISKGITDPCEIMKTYTPPSTGSWCDGVNHFAELIKNYKTPVEN